MIASPGGRGSCRSLRAPYLHIVLLPLTLLLGSCAHYVLYTDPNGPRYEGSFPARPDPEPGLRVVTFNIQYARHIDRAAALLQEDPHLRDADLLFLQEMDAPGTRRIAEALGLQYVYFPAVVHPSAGHDFGNAILSRWPIRDEKKVILPHLARLAHSERIATAGTVEIDGVPVRLYSIHVALPLTLSGRDRRDQLRRVLDDASEAPGPVIIAGDFNSHGLGEFFANTGFTWASRKIGSTKGLFDVDQIFLRGFRLAEPADIGVVHENRGASDHRPVWALLAPDSIPRLPRGGYRFACRDTSIAIKRFAWVDSSLARGARPGGGGIAALRARGFRTIIDLTANTKERREAAAESLAYFALPMTAHLWSKPPTDAEVREFFQITLDPSRRPVFIHCAHGVDRTGTMAALYRIEAQGWQPAAALEEMRLLGFHNWYRALSRYVGRYTPHGYAAPESAARPAPDQGSQAR